MSRAQRRLFFWKADGPLQAEVWTGRRQQVVTLVRGWCERRWPERALRLHAAGVRPLESHRVGHLGELLARKVLRRAGARVVAQRLLTKHGEIDLASRERDTLIVHEVKTGFRGPRYRPGQRLDYDQALRIERAAQELGRRVHAESVRLELIEVHLQRTGAIEVERQPLVPSELR